MGTPGTESMDANRVSAGDDAPDFTLRGARGDEFTLNALRGRQRALLMFYPQDMTSG